MDWAGLRTAQGLGGRAEERRPQVHQLALERLERRYALRLRITGARPRVDETLDPGIFELVPADALWAQAWVIDGPAFADAVASLGLLVEDGPAWLQACLGDVQLSYAAPSSAGEGVVHVLHPAPAPDGTIERVWSELAVQLTEYAAGDPELGLRVEREDEDGVALLHVWGRPYRYEPPRPPSADPRIYTLGADGEPGGEGADADVSTEDWERP